MVENLNLENKKRAIDLAWSNYLDCRVMTRRGADRTLIVFGATVTILGYFVKFSSDTVSITSTSFQICSFVFLIFALISTILAVRVKSSAMPGPETTEEFFQDYISVPDGRCVTNLIDDLLAATAANSKSLREIAFWYTSCLVTSLFAIIIGLIAAATA